jgi:hypothetical protein
MAYVPPVTAASTTSSTTPAWQSAVTPVTRPRPVAQGPGRQPARCCVRNARRLPDHGEAGLRSRREHLVEGRPGADAAQRSVLHCQVRALSAAGRRPAPAAGHSSATGHHADGGRTDTHALGRTWERLTLTCTALLIVVGSEVIPSLEPLSGRAREPPRPGHYGRPATTRTRESAQRQAEGQVR